MTRPASPARGRRERGAALLLVSIFMIAAIALVFALAFLSVKDAEDEGGRHADKVAQATLRAAMASALNEINAGADLDDDGGIGSVGAGLGGNRSPGVIRWSAGSTLSQYRLVIRPVGPDLNMVMVAATPTFAAPRRVAAAQIRIAPTIPPTLIGQESAFLGDGPLGSGSSLKGKATFFDPKHAVPAIRIGDPDFYDDFLDVFVDGGAKVEGTSLSTPGAVGVGEDTVENAGGGVISAQRLEAIETAITDWVADHAPGSSGTVAVLGDKANGTKFDQDLDANAAFPGAEVFWLSSGNNMRMEGGATITGKGTLLITRRLIVQGGATLDWDGDVIVYGSDQHSRLEIGQASGTGTVTINGNVILLADANKRAEFETVAGGVTTVNGSVLALSVSGEAEVETTSGGGAGAGGVATINGLLSLLGNTIDVRVGGTGLNVNGMMVVSVYEAGALKRFWVDTELTCIYDHDNLQRAVESLGQSFDAFGVPPSEWTGWKSLGYVELNASRTLLDMDQAIAEAEQAGTGLGIPEGWSPDVGTSGGTGSGSVPTAPPPTDPSPTDPPPTDPPTTDPPPTDPPPEPPPEVDPNWDPALGIILDSEPLLGPNNNCHCGATVPGSNKKYKYGDHHGKNF